MSDIVILCGGLGTRLREVTGETPKVLAEIGDRPFLHFLTDFAAGQGFKRFVLCAGYKAGDVEKYFKDKCPGLTIAFSREDRPLGTGGALRHAAGFIQSETVIVLNGDSFCRVDYMKLLEAHRQSGCRATIVASRMPSAGDYGRLVLDENGRVVSFAEKSGDGPGYVNAGVYCFNRQLVDSLPSTVPLSLEKDVFPSLLDKGICAFVTEQPFYDIGTPERYLKAREIFGHGQ